MDTGFRKRSCSTLSLASVTFGTGRPGVRPAWRPGFFVVLPKYEEADSGIPKKKRGRPATGRDPVTAIRLSGDIKKRVDSWAAKQEDKPGRSEAIRRLVETALATTGPAPKRSKKAAAKAAGMAGEMIDRLADKSASPEEQAKRKR